MPFKKNDPNINKNGRPPGAKSFTTKVREAIEKIADGSGQTYEEAFVKSIIQKAIFDKDPQIMKLVWEMFDGKPLQRIGNPDGSNLLPTPIYGGNSKLPVQKHLGNSKDIPAEEED